MESTRKMAQAFVACSVLKSPKSHIAVVDALSSYLDIFTWAFKQICRFFNNLIQKFCKQYSRIIYLCE